jgi:cell division protein FtsL
LENINIDLEYRLEQQAKQTMQAEHEYTEIDRSWKVKFTEMEKVQPFPPVVCAAVLPIQYNFLSKLFLLSPQEADEWKKRYEEQTNKTDKVRDHLNRTERELYGILQRKYQFMRGGMPHGAGGEVHASQHHPHTDSSSGGGTAGAGAGAGAGARETTRTPPSGKHPPRHLSTPLSASGPGPGPVEDLCEVYQKLTPELRERRFLMDLGDFFGA